MFNSNEYAVVISSGQILGIEKVYATLSIETIKLDGKRAINTIINEYNHITIDTSKINFLPKVDTNHKGLGGFDIKYQLSNGKSYNENELIIGKENIRDYTLKNILNGV